MANDGSSPAPEAVGEGQGVRDPGRWVHRRTGVPLGGGERTLEFTVIGMTIANGMLSLLGSTLLDPFAPHLKQAPPQSVNRKARHEKEVMEVDLEDEDHAHDAKGILHLEDDGPFTDRLIESRNSDIGVGPTVDSVRTQSDERAEKKRKRKERDKTKEAAVEGSPVKRKKTKEDQH